MLAVIYNLENVQFKNPFSSLGTIISYLVLGKALDNQEPGDRFENV